MEEYDILHKLLVLGYAASGKTCMLFRFANDTFSESYKTTIGLDFVSKTVKITDKILKMKIWDTAGQKRFQSPSSIYYKGTHGIMILFDITNRVTFNKVDEFFSEVKMYMTEPCPILLVGTHSDLQAERKVSEKEAMTKANEYGVKYIEVSSKTGDNVSTAFDILNADIMGIPSPNLVPTLPATSIHTAPTIKHEKITDEVLFYKKKLEIIEKVTRLLGAEGSLLVENIHLLLSAKPGQRMEVDEEGNVNISQLFFQLFSG